MSEKNGKLLSFLDASHRGLHQDSACTGNFRFLVAERIPYAFISLGVEFLPYANLIVCNACGASFFAPGFERGIERRKVVEILSKKNEVITPKELRFLRIASGLSQPDMAARLDFSVPDYHAAEIRGGLSGLLFKRRIQGLFDFY